MSDEEVDNLEADDEKEFEDEIKKVLEEEEIEEEVKKELEEEVPKIKRRRRQRLVVDEDPKKTRNQMIFYSLLIFASLALPMVISIPIVFLEVDPILSFVIAIIMMMIGIAFAAIIINFKILAEPKRKK